MGLKLTKSASLVDPSMQVSTKGPHTLTEGHELRRSGPLQDSKNCHLTGIDVSFAFLEC